MRIVDITSQPVELYKIIKFEGMAASGAEAKSVIADGLVKVNDVTETRKRKKIVAGDTIEFGDEKILIQLQG
jgi:ribosome-associated protein